MRPLLFLGLATTLAACAETPQARPPTFDAPIPANEPRATLRVTVDLEPVSDCDERFDLALYQDRGVELVTWDGGKGCVGRHVTVRFVPKRTPRDALIEEVKRLSRKVQVIQG